jgi:hypothetical protein
MHRDEFVEIAMKAYKDRTISEPASPGLKWLRGPIERVVDTLLPLIKKDEQERLSASAANITITKMEEGGLDVSVDDPNGTGWTPVALSLIPSLVQGHFDTIRLQELRAEVQSMRNEAMEAQAHGVGIEVQMAKVGIAVLDDVLSLFDEQRP